MLRLYGLTLRQGQEDFNFDKELLCGNLSVRYGIRM